MVYDEARGDGRRLWVPGALGALATLPHPWNGELLIALVLAAEVVMLASRRYTLDHLRLTAATVIGTGVPLVYYATLGKVDVNWKLAQIASKHAFPFWEIALAIAPLLLPAIVAYRTRPRTFLAIATRLWPLAAFAIFLLSGTSLGATPLHAFQGITLPLGVLAVEGIQLLGWLVPGKMGRRTYVGDCLWSEPNCWGLTLRTRALFGGRLAPDAARRLVVSSGARFVLADCDTTADMRKLLGPVIRAAHNFGCAAVYEVE